MHMKQDIEIRAASFEDAEYIAKVHLKAWQEIYQKIFKQEYLNSISYEKKLALRRHILTDPSKNSMHLVVVNRDIIVGFCDAGPVMDNSSGELGEVYALYLLDGYKRKKLGSQLLQMADKFLKDQGLLPYIIWVLEQNKPACSLYSKLGGKVMKERIDDRSGIAHKVVGYVFS